MTIDEIRHALAAGQGFPAEALAAAVPQAAALAPEVISLMQRAAGGEMLLPRDENLLFYGLYALAAGRAAAALPALLSLLRRPEEQLDRLFGDALTENLPGFLLSLYDGNPEPFYAAIEDPEIDGVVKWAFFQALAWLTWEGRVGREGFLEFLDRFDRDEMAPLGDPAWMGWQDAVMSLGLKQFEDRVRRGWDAGRNDFWRKTDREDWLERLEKATANPDRPVMLDEHIAPIDDPVAALSWRWQWVDEPGPGEPADDEDESGAPKTELPPDPAADIALSEEEIGWLADFLASRTVPETTMSLEQVDGFFAALAVGPELVLPSEYMPVVWGTENGEGPVFAGREQANFVNDLFTRLWNAIARRADVPYPHIPLLRRVPSDENVAEWAEGFMTGIGLRAAAWRPLLQDKEIAPLIGMLINLAEGRLVPKDEASEDAAEERRQLVGGFALLPMTVRGFWENYDPKLHPTEPLRAAKIGRNDPCPCGSGRKYKRCCGAAGR